MSNALSDLGIQSWCYRNFKTIPSFTENLKKAGVTASEVCGVQVNFQDEENFPTAIKQFNDAGVKILSIGVNCITGKDKVADEKGFKFCKLAGAKFMSITFRPEGMWDAFRFAEQMADKYDLHLGIHNHGGYDWLGNSVMLDYIFKNTSKRIGLTLDTAWAIDAKQNPVEMAEKFADRLYGVHVKDFTYTPARQPQDVVIGTGNLDLPKFMATLKKINFKGFTVIEYEGDAENPVPVLKDCVAAMKKAV